MVRNKIFFRADADEYIGFGHFVRTLALAEMLKDEFDCTFFTAAPNDYQRNEVSNVCKLVELKVDTKFEDFIAYLSGDEIVFLDNYFFLPEYEKLIKKHGCKLVVLSPATQHHYADIVINYIETDYSKYSIEPYSRIYAGQEWTILRKPFLNPNFNSIRKKDSVVISFGGTDQFCLTEKVLEHLNRNSISIICTSRISKRRIELFKEKGARIYMDVNAETIAKLFETTEYAILSSSSICIEALSRKCKILAGYYIDNQIKYYQALCKKNLIYPLGNLLANESLNKIENKITNCSHQKFMECGFCGQKDRYIEIFKELCI